MVPPGRGGDEGWVTARGANRNLGGALRDGGGEEGSRRRPQDRSFRTTAAVTSPARGASRSGGGLSAPVPPTENASRVGRDAVEVHRGLGIADRLVDLVERPGQVGHLSSRPAGAEAAQPTSPCGRTRRSPPRARRRTGWRGSCTGCEGAKSAPHRLRRRRSISAGPLLDWFGHGLAFRQTPSRRRGSGRRAP